MSFGAQNRAKSAPYTVDFDVKLWKSPDLKEKKAAFLSKTCFSDDSRTFQRAADFIFVFDLLIWHQKVRGNFVINHRFRDYRSPRLKGQKLASYKVLISSIGVVFGHILEKWWFEDFMKIVWKNYVVGCFIALAKRWVVCACYVARCLIPSLV